VRPECSVPYQIERLTGIDTAELLVAPRIYDVGDDLVRFIGKSVLVGQNIGFDIEILRNNGVPVGSESIDTFDLAQLLLPGLREYNLRAVAAALGIGFPVQHRALADAEAAASVFLGLRKKLTELPRWLVEEVHRLAIEGAWSVSLLTRDVLAENACPDTAAGLTTADYLAPPEEIARPLAGGIDAPRATAFEALRLLEAAASHPDVLPGFEARPEQARMLEAVANALAGDRHLIAEAGTGTGKSLAYLLPAALTALRTRERIVVSTDTIGLQEQLFGKDLPAVQALIEATEGEELRTAQLKGRRNYLCLLRWTSARHAAPASPEEARLMARLLPWLARTQTGDRAELNLHPSYDAAWSRLTAENVACLQTPCQFVKEGSCFLMRARKRAEAAHVLVVNHALLLSDVATGGHVLPPYRYLIVDEAHNVEEEATSRFSFRGGEAEINDFLDRVGRRGSGLIASVNEAARGPSAGLLGPASYVSGLTASLAEAANRLRGRLAEPFQMLATVLKEHAEPGNNDDRLLVTRAIRVQPAWSQVEIASENLVAALDATLTLIEDLVILLTDPAIGLLDQESLAADAADLLERGRALHAGLNAALLEEDAATICWLERSRQTGEVAICSAPLVVADLLRDQLFGARDSVVLTGATLSTEGGFDHIRERLGLDDADELLLGSPFDHERSTLLAFPTDLPEPEEPYHAQRSAELLVDMCRASQGRALVLFTSYGSLNTAAGLMREKLEEDGILVLAHGNDGRPNQLLNALRENPRTVLLGTASFWEGVDIAGDALSLLVIARLPFPVPSDPIYQARSGLYDLPFEQYGLPQAIIRFRQGFGRLIRTSTDRGVCVVLDRRIRSRKYGDAFLRSLPDCTKRDLPSRDLPAAIEQWLS
jgi:DNA polymerase-3 subunit epsilon/ATP-dependent DNA helicase DinG